jgi:hypothetical protein
MPLNFKNLWRNVPPNLSEINAYLGPIKQWLVDHAQTSDYVLIQGDFGATFIIVRFALDKKLGPKATAT